MRAIFKDGILVLLPETDAERSDLDNWTAVNAGHVFHLSEQSGAHTRFHDLGLHADACRDPINILYETGEERWWPISNLAETPFVMRGRNYASVEGFWQGLKFADEAARKRVASLSGKPAKRAANEESASEFFVFDHERYAAGGPGHHALMAEACQAKFYQNVIAREALLATGDRPLVHRVRKDSKTIPGALMADIWMRLRRKLRRQEND